MFVGRKKELAGLETEYTKNGFSMTVIYGRRRVGKSTLIREFIKNKNAIYYTATKVGARRNLELLTERVLSALSLDVSGMHFDSLDALLTFLTGHLPSDKLILVIDELPYWADQDPGMLSTLQKYIDMEWLDKNLYLILCGSSLSFMEDEVLSRKSPIFGRRTSQIRLEPFDYLEAALFVPNYTLEEKAICFGVTGGIAKYLSLFDPDTSLDENLKRLFFSTDGYLYDEPRNLLIQEFSDTALVNNIIEQIASGENTPRLISDKVHENESTVLYSLKRLIEVGLVDRKRCITEEKNKKKVQYILKDSMFRFWFEYIPKAVSLIEIDQGSVYYDKAVKPVLHDYMGGIFEEMCRSFVLKKGMSGEFNCLINNVGSWWGTEILTDTAEKKVQPADIDVVGISDLDKAVVYGECKFRTKKIDRSNYETLVRRSRAVRTSYRTAAYLLFSLGGFSDWYPDQTDPMMKTYTLDDLYQP